MKKNILIAPSILAGNFGCLAKDAKRAVSAGADWLHVDIMDGHFVPNITIGPQAVAAIKKVVNIPLDIHLMLTHPQKYIRNFVEAGADIITVHIESKHDVKKTLNDIKKLGCKCGLVLNPDTSVSKLKKYLRYLDVVLVMSVYPGFGNQKFMPEVLPKVKELRRLIDKTAKKIYLEIDGGINIETFKTALDAGADVLVSGSGIYKYKNLAPIIKKLRGREV